MRPILDKNRSLAFVLLLGVIAAAGQPAPTGHPQTADGTIRIPNRAATPLFSGKQGEQKTEIHYDPATKLVTLKLLVQDPNGYFIPNIGKDNFVVFENGVRQQITSASVEDAPASLGLLLENGGRYLPLSQALAKETSEAAQSLVDAMTHEDSAAIWKYNSKVETITGFTQDRSILDAKLLTLGTPELSETNLYDAVIATVDQMRPVKGRKAIVLISSGNDTFSEASRQDALKAAQASDSAIYAIGITPHLNQIVTVERPKEPTAVIDWQKAESNLRDLAKAAGGRAYFPESNDDFPAIDSDLLENLKVRYVISYHSSSNTDLNSPRTVRVELVNSSTGEPLEIVDANRRKVPAHVVLQQSYIPAAAMAK